MNKLFAFVLGATLSLSAVANTVNNTQKGSYGRWYDDKQGEPLVITNKGLHIIYSAEKSCQKKSYFFHEKSMVKGSQLLRDIQKSIEEQIDTNQPSQRAQQIKAEMKPFQAIIQPQKSYMKIIGGLSCADGAQAFIYVNDKVSIGMLSAPDDNYYLLKKK